MILYQFAKWMEERRRLNKTIREASGNVEDLISRKEWVEEQLVTKATEWLNDGIIGLEDITVPEMLPAGEAEHEFAL